MVLEAQRFTWPPKLSNSATSTLNLALCTEWQIRIWFAEHQKKQSFQCWRCHWLWDGYGATWKDSWFCKQNYLAAHWAVPRWWSSATWMLDQAESHASYCLYWYPFGGLGAGVQNMWEPGSWAPRHFLFGRHFLWTNVNFYCWNIALLLSCK